MFSSEKKLRTLSYIKKIGPANDAKQRDPPRDVSPAGRRAHEQPTASRRTEKLNRRKAQSACGVGLEHPVSEDSIYQSALKLKRAAGNKDTQCFVPDMRYGGSALSFKIDLLHNLLFLKKSMIF